MIASALCSSFQRGRGHTGRSPLAGGTSIELTPCRAPHRACRGSRPRRAPGAPLGGRLVDRADSMSGPSVGL
eukprot:tig00021017_g17180.t1